MKDKRISRWSRAGIILSLAVFVFSSITAYTQWSRYARADSVYHALQEKNGNLPRHPLLPMNGRRTKPERNT